MYCSQCGEKLKDDASFCIKCGAKQKTEVEVTRNTENKRVEKKKNTKAKIVIAILIVVLASLCYLLVVLVTGNTKYDPISKEAIMYDYAEAVFLSARGEVYQPNHDIANSETDANADYSKRIYRENDTNDLFYIDCDFSPIRIAGNVEKFVISYTGNYVAYMCDIDEENTGTLYLYCLKTGESTQIDTEVYPDYLCLSPEGKKIVYLKREGTREESSMWLGGIGGDCIEIDDDGCYPLAISDNGKRLYYINKTKLYFYNGKSSEKIASDVSSTIWFNEDITEVLYNSDGKSYVYSKKLKNPQKISSASVRTVAQLGLIERYYGSGGACVLGVDTLKECVFISEDPALYWLDGESLEMIKIASTNYNYQVSKDGKSIIYALGNKIYKIEQLSKNMDKTILYEGDVDGIIANSDLSKIYFYTDEDLYYLKKNGDIERLSNDLYLNSAVLGAVWAFNHEKDKLFFVENDTLMIVNTTAKSKTKVMDDVKTLYRQFSGVIFEQYVVEEFKKYYMGDGEPVILDRD